MNIFIIFSIWGCADKTTESPQPDSGIVIGPPPQPEDTASTDTAEDTGTVDTGEEDTSTEDSGLADSGIDTASEPSQEDTAVQNIQMPDFVLPDVNPYSATMGATISVRDQMESISGWYFIKAT